MEERFRPLLRADQIDTSDAVLDAHARGESYDRAVRPDVVLYPESAAEVEAIVARCAQDRIPVTPVAANSSLEGHTVPLRGGVSLDLGRMNRILSFSPEDFLMVVQPAVTYPQVNARARRDGLFFPIDPGAEASLGGMVSTNASGTMAVRYGVTRDYVAGLEVVTGDGRRVRLGGRARKSSSGYDLCALFAGAEGTLGVITEITLRLVGLPEDASAARVPFPDARAATTFVTDLVQAGVPVARCELLDPGSIAAVNAHSGTAYPEQMTVFLEFHGNPAGVRADAALAEQLARQAGALAFEASADPAERERLWQARHRMFYAAVAQNPGRRSVVTDVAVPISRLPEAVTRALDDCRRSELRAYLVGHVGDGNFHVVMFPAEDGSEDARADAVVHRMVEHALALGGTCTGEHGVGVRKLPYVALEHGPAVPLMRRVKQALDPMGIMNPGKKIPD